jgi:hypothetical protein
MTTYIPDLNRTPVAVMAARASGIGAGSLLAVLAEPSLLTITVFAAVTVGVAQQVLP